LRKTFSTEISTWVSEDPNSILLLGDIGVGSFTKLINQFPDRALNVGILEQSMISFASGLVLGEKRIIVHTIAPFMVGRAYEQLKIDFGYRNLAGLFVSVGASFDYGKLGSTHHAPEDILLFSTIPNSRMFVPGNKEELKAIISQHRKNPKLDYLRIPQISHTQNIEVKDGFAKLIAVANRPTIVAIGPFLDVGYEVAQRLNFALLYINTIDSSTSELFLENSHPYFIIEPFFTGTTQFAINIDYNPNQQLINFGIPREFQRDYINAEDRLSVLNLDSESIVQRINKFMKLAKN
jgi:transketolase